MSEDLKYCIKESMADHEKYAYIMGIDICRLNETDNAEYALRASWADII